MPQPQMKPQSTSPIRIVEATTGAQLAQVAGVLLRSSRLGEPWRINASDRVLLAFADGTPIAVAEVQPVQFGTVGIRRFRAPSNTPIDAGSLREHMTNFLRTAPVVSNPLTALAA